MGKTLVRRKDITTALLVVSVMLVGLISGAAASPAPKPAVPATYVLGPGDTIDVQVFGEPDLSRTVMIKPDGTVALALVNEVKASGKTTGQLQEELTKMYAKYLKTPSISVVVHEFRIDRVYLLGQFKTPGEFQLRNNVGILELVASA